MINPIIITVGAALILSVMSVSIINKPKKPIVTGTVLVVLICFVIFTFMIDNAISTVDTSDAVPFVYFLTMSEKLTYEGLAASFHTFMCFDIVLIAGSLLTLFAEMLFIRRKGAKK